MSETLLSSLDQAIENIFAQLHFRKLILESRTDQKYLTKYAVTTTLLFGLAGLFLNLLPLRLGEDLETFLGPLFSTIPALIFGPIPGIVSGIGAAIPFLLREDRVIHFVVQSLHTLLIAGLVRSSLGREYLLEVSLTFWLLVGSWFVDRLSLISAELVETRRLAVILCSVLGTVDGNFLAFGVLVTLSTRVWRELVPIGSYLNRISAGVLTSIILLTTIRITGNIANIASIFNAEVTETITYELLSSWLSATLWLVLASLLLTRLIMLPLIHSLWTLIRLSAVTGEPFDTLVDLRKYRPRVYEFYILRHHFRRVIASLERTIQSLREAQTRIASQNEHLIAQKIQMEYAAKRDFLTGLLNLRSLESHMALIWPLIRAGNLNIGILLIDADHFKTFNDTYGHLAGNTVLADLAPILLSQVRNDDIVARFGGEEFAVVVHYVDAEQCIHLAERIRQAIENSDIGITVSIGCATSSAKDSNWHDILKRADTALYRAKEMGRNRVEYEKCE